MDLLYSAALSYTKLCNFTYDITVGRKNESMLLHIKFMPINFYHLAGFHYINDILGFGESATHSDKTLIVKNIINKMIVYKNVSISSHFNYIQDRINWLHKIDGIITGMFYKKHFVLFL